MPEHQSPVQGPERDPRAVVERELELELLVQAPAVPVPVTTCLSYRASDPHAVHFTFHVDSQEGVHWAFARDLLIDGVFRPCGDGDVRVWPVKSAVGSFVCLALTAPGGRAVLRAPAGALTAWLERTMRLVPPGEEVVDVPAVAPFPRPRTPGATGATGAADVTGARGEAAPGPREGGVPQEHAWDET